MKTDFAPCFDAHFHIIDSRFPLVENQGYLPPEFICDQYLSAVAGFGVTGGAIVSGSFQAFDQSYLIASLKALGPKFVGVAQLPASVSDSEILTLNSVGVRAVRFNVKRGGSAELAQLEEMARRVYDLANWHVELYIDSRELPPLVPVLSTLPKVSIDHLGLSEDGLPTLLRLAEKGVRVKATGFGRIDLDIPRVLRELMQANPDSVMFGTDLPGTRARRPFEKEDLNLIVDTLGEARARKVFYENAVQFYRPTAV